MPFVDNKEDAASYAKFFSRLDKEAFRFLAYRDVPELIQKFVSGTKTLDYGCGAGKSSMFLKSLGLDVDGVDINADFIKNVKSTDPTGKYDLIKSAEIPADDNHYDLVFSSWVLVEVSSKTELLKIVRDIARVLKAGGTLITIVCSADHYNTDWLDVNTEFEENKKLQSGSPVRVHFKEIDLTISDFFWTEEDYREVFNEVGLSIVHAHKPLGREDDGYAWVTEKVKSPYIVYVAKKISG